MTESAPPAKEITHYTLSTALRGRRMEMSEMSGLDETPAGTVRIGDRRVQRIGFGSLTLSLTRDADGARDPEAAIRLVRHAIERGVDFIDTANIYGLGRSERLIADAL